jgi:hypothetical protein
LREIVQNYISQSQMKGFLNSSCIRALPAYEYRAISSADGQDLNWRTGSTSVGIVYERNKLGSIIQVQRIEDELFESKEQAEQHGLELCKEWIDKQSRA